MPKLKKRDYYVHQRNWAASQRAALQDLEGLSKEEKQEVKKARTHYYLMEKVFEEKLEELDYPVEGEGAII